MVFKKVWLTDKVIHRGAPLLKSSYLFSHCIRGWWPLISEAYIPLGGHNKRILDGRFPNSEDLLTLSDQSETRNFYSERTNSTLPEDLILKKKTSWRYWCFKMFGKCFGKECFKYQSPIVSGMYSRCTVFSVHRDMICN